MRDPFEQLERSHRRLEERLDDLSFMAREAKETGRADDVGVREVAAFFARAVRRHEEDEEKSLFPRLAAAASAAGGASSRSDKGADDLRASIDKLAREHREHEALHAALDRVVDVLGGANEDAAAIAELGRIAEALAAAYRGHVEEEEKSLFPAARAMLDDDARTAIANEMEERRADARAAR